MLIQFTRWMLDAKGRTPVAINPERVDVIEHYGDAFKTTWGEEYPAAARIIMKGKQEYIVQGSVEEVNEKLHPTSDNEG